MFVKEKLPSMSVLVPLNCALSLAFVNKTLTPINGELSFISTIFLESEGICVTGIMFAFIVS